MEQKRVWNKIAKAWNACKYRINRDAEEFLKDHNKGNVLDLGSGSGRNFARINGQLHATDFSKKMLKIAKKNAKKNDISVKIKLMKDEKVPFEDNFFDAVMCIAVLHCVESDNQRAKLMKEMYRVLKPGSEGIITVWSRKNQRIKNKPREGIIPWTVKAKKYGRYTYIFEMKELEKLLRQVGFKIISSHEDQNIVIKVKK